MPYAALSPQVVTTTYSCFWQKLYILRLQSISYVAKWWTLQGDGFSVVVFSLWNFPELLQSCSPLKLVSQSLLHPLCQAESHSGSSSLLNCCFRSLYLQMKISRSTVAPPTHTPQEKVPKSMKYSEVFSDITGIRACDWFWFILYIDWWDNWMSDSCAHETIDFIISGK